MRLRNIPAAAPAVEASDLCIKDAASHKGHWKYLEMTTRSALKSAWARDALSWT